MSLPNEKKRTNSNKSERDVPVVMQVEEESPLNGSQIREFAFLRKTHGKSLLAEAAENHYYGSFVEMG